MEYARDMKAIRVDYEHKIETTKVSPSDSQIDHHSLRLAALLEWEGERGHSPTAWKRTQEGDRAIARESGQVRRWRHTSPILSGEPLARSEREVSLDRRTGIEVKTDLLERIPRSIRFRISKLLLDTTNEKNQIIRKEKDYQVQLLSSSSAHRIDVSARILCTRCTTTSPIALNVSRMTPTNRSSSIPRPVLVTTSNHGWAKWR